MIPKTVNPADDQAPAAAARARRSRTRSPPRCTRCSSSPPSSRCSRSLLAWLLREVPLRTAARSAGEAIPPPARRALRRAKPPRSTQRLCALLGNSQGAVILFARVFYLRYLRNELVRRRTRTILTLLGLGARRRAGDRDLEPLDRARRRTAQDARPARRHRHRPDRHAAAAAEPERRVRRPGAAAATAT